MQTLSQQPQLFYSEYEGFHQNAHIQRLKKSSKSVSKYLQSSCMLQSSSMLYSPNRRFIDDKAQKNVNVNTMNSRQHQQSSNLKILTGDQNIDRSLEGGCGKNSRNYNGSNRSPMSFEPHNLGKVVSRLETRLEVAEVKIASLTNVVKLLQKYSQTKDDQYQKQKENVVFAKNAGERVQQIQSLQIQNKIKQFNAISKQMKRQIQQVTELKHKLEANLSGSFGSNGPAIVGQMKKLTSNKSKKSDFKSPASQSSYLDIQDVALAFEQMQQRLRDEINKKIEICLRQIKKIGSNGSKDVSGVDQNLFQEQINALNFAINKVQNQCTRNKMILENQIEEVMTRIPTGHHSASFEYLPRKLPNFPDPEKNTQRAVRDKSRNKSHSRKKSEERSVSRDKSKSNLKNNQEKLQQRKRQKQEELRQAIRRKKQTKQKLKQAGSGR